MRTDDHSCYKKRVIVTFFTCMRSILFKKVEYAIFVTKLQ